MYDTQSFNRYSYVNNNPLKYIDPSGHFSMNIGGITLVDYNPPSMQDVSDELQKGTTTLTNFVNNTGTKIGNFGAENENNFKGAGIAVVAVTGGVVMGAATAYALNFNGFHDGTNKYLAEHEQDIYKVAIVAVAVGSGYGVSLLLVDVVGLSTAVIAAGATSGAIGGYGMAKVNGASDVLALQQAFRGAVVGAIAAGATYGILTEVSNVGGLDFNDFYSNIGIPFDGKDLVYLGSKSGVNFGVNLFTYKRIEDNS